MRRSRVKAAALLAFLLVLLAAWWLGRDDGSPATAPPDGDPPPAAPPPPVEGPAPTIPDAAPAEEPLVTATVRALDAKYGEAAKESLLEAEGVAGPPGPELAVEEAGPGAWTLKGVRGTVVRLVATSAGFVPAERWFLLGLRPEMKVHLAPVGTVAIRVHAAADGAPIPGARVHVAGEPALFRRANANREWLGRTDSAGYVNCPEAGPGRRLRVTVLADGFAPVSEAIEAVPPGVALSLVQGTRLRVRIHQRGVPIEGARAIPFGPAAVPLLPAALVPATGPDGIAEVHVPAYPGRPWRADLVVTSPTFNPKSVQASEGDAGATVDAALGLATIWGVTVVDTAGAPVPDLPVRLVPVALGTYEAPDTGDLRTLEAEASIASVLPAVEGRTDSKGGFTVVGLPSRSTWTAACGGAGDFPLAVIPFTDSELDDFPRVRLPASRARTIEATTPRGLPFRGAEVFLVPREGFEDPSADVDAWLRRAASARTDARGRAVVRDAVDSPLAVAVRAGPILWGAVEPAAPDGVERARLHSPALLRVRVSDASGSPFASALVRVSAADATGGLPPALRDGAIQEAITGPDGVAEFEVPGDAPLSVAACAVGALDAREVAVGPLARSGELTVVLAAPRVVWVSVEGTAGRIPGATVEAYFEGDSLPRPARGIAGPDGVLSVTVPAGGGDRNPWAWFRATGPAEGWAKVRRDSLVDGSRLLFLDPQRAGILLLRVVEDRHWPRGTAFRWSLEGATGAGSSGAGLVGEPLPLPGGSDSGSIVIRLPGAVPIPALWGRDSRNIQTDRVKSEYKAALSDGRKKTKEETKALEDDFKRRLRALDEIEKSRDGGSTDAVLPLRVLPLANATGGWARALIVEEGSGATALATGPLPDGATRRVLVDLRRTYSVKWEPLAAESR